MMFEGEALLKYFYSNKIIKVCNALLLLALIPFVKNGLTTAEWDKWVGKDIPMQSNE